MLFSLTGLDLIGPTTGIVGQSYSFTATAQPLTITLPITYTWQADEHTPIVHSRSNATDTVDLHWQTPGVKTITATVGSETALFTSTHTIALYSAVQADFSATPASGEAPLTVTFTNLSSGDFATNTWELGDGTISTSENVTHTYAFGGTYSVTLTVSGPGGTDLVSRSEYIVVDSPSDFSPSIYLPLLQH